MQIYSDVNLYGEDWQYAYENLCEKQKIFVKRPVFEIYILSMAIGIFCDKQLEISNSREGSLKQVPRSVLVNYDQHTSGNLDIMFQAAILHTQNINLSESDRRKMAFDEGRSGINPMAFLTLFANYGVKKLNELIGITAEETMDNIVYYMKQAVSEDDSLSIY